jgi:NTP pyrophosphohydrolases including oxidative damage repair enzymes
MDLTGVRGRNPVDVTTQRREAAVIAPVVSREEGLALLFTKRADHLGEHPGQMSFPGGGREPEDASLRETALREANEEIGLRPHEVDIHGCLDDIDTVTDYAVRPFVASIPDRDYVPDDTEVAEISVLPVSALTDSDNYEAALLPAIRAGPIQASLFPRRRVHRLGGDRPHARPTPGVNDRVAALHGSRSHYRQRS